MMKTVWVVGDSTVNAGEDTKSCIPRIGWGDTLEMYFQNTVRIRNLAISGTSSKSFRSTDHYKTFLENIREGDALLVGFGHNDEKRGDVTFTSGTGDEKTEGSFAQSLYQYYVLPARKAGAEALLVTPIVRRAEDGNYTGDRIHVTRDGDYPQAIRDLGARMDIPVLDLTARTLRLSNEVDRDDDPDNDTIWQHGRTGSSDLCVDNTHTSMFGAVVNAWLLAEELQASGAALAKDLKLPLVSPLSRASYWKERSFNKGYVEPVYHAPKTAPALFPCYTDGHGNEFYATVFGDVMLGEKLRDFSFGTAEDGAMDITAGIYENNGKIEQSSDGIAMYFVRIPAGRSFSLSGRVRLESFETAGFAAVPAGFGVMARDEIYLNEENGSLLGDYVAGGIAFRPGVENGSNTFARRDGRLRFGGGELERLPRIGEEWEMEVFTTGDGYGARVGKHSPVLAGYDFALTRIDPDFVYIGFFAARTIRITVRDIRLVMDEKPAIAYRSFPALDQRQK
ncbi:MAG: GDSL-type esterase/lipase family protein [Lachnospiraceae bacterium]